MKRVFTIFVLSALFILVACQTNDSKSDENTSIKLGEVTRSLFYTPQYVALEKDFFSDEGLDVELQTTWGGDKTMTALLADNIDIALVGAETSIYVYAQNSKNYAINFAQLTQTDGTFLVAKNEHPDFTWDDLKDESFLGQRKGGMPQMVGEFVLKNHNIDPHKDLYLEQNVDFANIPSAFASDDFEFVQLFEPTASTMEKEGKGHVIASFGEESGHVPYTVFMAKDSYITENEDDILKFTKAIYKAQKWVQAHDPEEIAKVIAPYFDDTELDMLTASIKRYKDQGSFAETPIFNKEGWNNLKSIMDEAGELPEDISFEELVDNDFAEKVVDQ